MSIDLLVTWLILRIYIDYWFTGNMTYFKGLYWLFLEGYRKAILSLNYYVRVVLIPMKQKQNHDNTDLIDNWIYIILDFLQNEFLFFWSVQLFLDKLELP